VVCAKCGSNEVSITEEVYRHSNRILHKFIMLVIIVVGVIIIASGNEGSIGLGIMVILSSAVYRVVLRIYEHTRSAKSRTKCICLKCQNKWYIG